MNNTNDLNVQWLGGRAISDIMAPQNQYLEDEKERLTKSSEEDASRASSDMPLGEMPKRKSHLRRFLLLQLALIMLYTLFLIAVIYSGLGHSCNTPVVYTPASDVGEVEAKTLHTHLFEANAFKGKPGPSIDAAWENLFTNAYIRLSSEELQRLGRTSTPILDGSGDFLGALDMYHQLHCINYIYQFAHPEYYKVNETNISTADHVDHCIDMLRQVTMCRADTAIMTFSYQPQQPIAWPDFNMQHECRNWDAVNAWAGSAGRVLDQSDPDRFHEMVKNPDYGKFPNLRRLCRLWRLLNAACFRTVGGVFDGHDKK